MWLLGINTGLNSSAVLMNNSEPVFAIQEERLSRVKNQPGYPSKSIDAALSFAGLDKEEVNLICVGGTSTKLLRSREQELQKYHQRYQQFRPDNNYRGKRDRLMSLACRLVFRDLDHAEALTRENLRDYLETDGFLDRTMFFDHHLCHAASAYYGLMNNVDEKCLVFTLDGGGDRRTAAVFVGESERLSEISSSSSMSLGSLYAHVTYILGFTPHEHEYKLMGLAPYANPIYVDKIKQKLGKLIAFSDTDPLEFVNQADKRSAEKHRGVDKLEWIKHLYQQVQFERFDNLAAGLQGYVEDMVVEWVRRGVESTGIRNVALSGGFFMNVKANQLVSRLPQVEKLMCFPSCGDETNAFGAAFLGLRDLTSSGKIKLEQPARFAQFCLGPTPGKIPEVVELSRRKDFAYEKVEHVNLRIAREIYDGKIVARCSGPMEFGARALGNRSILAAPNNWNNIQRINRAIKKRDFWMPFAPAILSEHAEKYLEIPKCLQEGGSPYMMFTFDSKPEYGSDLICGLHQSDKTVRAQLVTEALYPELHKILTEFYKLSGIPAVLNTSFNLHGSPIVANWSEALEVFGQSDLDLLVIEDVVVSKG